MTAWLGSLLYRKYPQTLAVGKRRHIMYNRQLELVSEQGYADAKEKLDQIMDFVKPTGKEARQTQEAQRNSKNNS